jgi:glutamine synthetase
MKLILEYVWLDGHLHLRSKYKTIDWHLSRDFALEDVPTWNYDGSSTYQANTDQSEIILSPVALYKNPFFQNRPEPSFLVLCDTYTQLNNVLVPTPSNHRFLARQRFESDVNHLDPWFGIEQEYFMMDPTGHVPLAFHNAAALPVQQGEYYCAVGAQNVQERALAEQHYQYCLYAGLAVSGINAEVAPSQWEYQIGPCTGIDSGDQVWMSRYILQKVAETYRVAISFQPKPLPNPWNGSGLHTNFSTAPTRAPGGVAVIHTYINRLHPAHQAHLAVYGDNSQRLTGACETSDPSVFSCGYGHRGCSIRIPNETLQRGMGYFEDRRPASDADPYQVTGALFSGVPSPRDGLQ